MARNPPIATRWGLSRYVILFLVLALHAALLALLMRKSHTGYRAASVNPPVELLFIAPTMPPKIRSENPRPQRLHGNMAITMAPPVLDSPSSAPSTLTSPAASGSGGNGSGVDWAAEARRALQAFEIRNHQPPSGNSVSSSPGEDNWWPRGKHHAGDQYKTANGDWIVWINSSCYQIASAGGNAYAPGAAPPRVVCAQESRAPRVKGTSRATPGPAAKHP